MPRFFPRPCRIFVFLYNRVLNYSEDFADEETYVKLVATKLEIYIKIIITVKSYYHQIMYYENGKCVSPKELYSQV